MENPFVVTGRIKPEFFCDRVEESERLVRTLTNGSNLVLISPRRVGKTGLIRFCFDKPAIRDQYITIFIDILRTSSLNELVFLLGQAVFNAIGSRGQRWMKGVVGTLRSLSGSFGYDPVSGMPTFDVKLGDIRNPEYTLGEIFQCIEQANMHCLIAIDEFQQVVNYPEKNIEALLRTHVQHCSNANFVFSGSERHIMDEMFTVSARPFYNSADMMNMDVISLDKYAAFATAHLHQGGREIEADAISHVYQLFDGNTYYLQKTFHEAFAQTTDGDVVTVAMVHEIVESMLLDSSRKYGEVMSRLSLPQKELLYAIAADVQSRQITSMAFIKRHNLRSASSVQSAVKKLLDNGLVSMERGAYYVDDQLFRLWLTAEPKVGY